MDATTQSTREILPKLVRRLKAEKHIFEIQEKKARKKKSNSFSRHSEVELKLDIRNFCGISTCKSLQS